MRWSAPIEIASSVWPVASRGLPARNAPRCPTSRFPFLAAARDKAAAAGVPVETHHKWHDNPYQAIIDTALEEACDLIAMASHGRRGMAAVVMGSQATRILTHSKIPVLVYR